uniref:Uncharacterized protein n=1 Tax=Rhizophora mucronata TaxID=61149 RepID=A0A2P2QX14_RHIMU
MPKHGVWPQSLWLYFIWDNHGLHHWGSTPSDRVLLALPRTGRGTAPKCLRNDYCNHFSMKSK